MPSPFRLFPLLLCSALAHAAPDTTDWPAAARQDMQFAIDTIRSSYAGVVKGRVDVLDALENGGRTGSVEAANVRTEQDHKRAMLRFIDGFGDPHTGIDLRSTIQSWNGIVIDRVDGVYRVIWSEPGWPGSLPPKGAVVQSCDGVWTGTYLKTKVAPFISDSPEYTTSASEAARQVMFERGAGWAPKACDVTLADGSSRHVDLPQRLVTDGIGAEHIAQVRKLVNGKARPVGMTALTPSMQWVSMPDFNGRLSGAAYEKLYAQLSALKGATWVVFDLRGNGGGDSSWGNRALKALYGEQYGERLSGTAAYSKYLIANQATVGVYERYSSLPEFATSKSEFDDILDKLKAAIGRGDKMVQVEGGSREQAAALAVQLRQRPAGPRIAAVIDRGCFSSCMNFIQQISAIGDTVLLGELTLGY